MQITTTRTLAGTETRLMFSAAERKALERAAAIAEEARERCAGFVGAYEWEDDPQDMDLAHVEHGAREISDGVLVAESFEPMGFRIAL